MAANTKLPPPPSQNGVITAPPKGAVGGNRKKQKRRAKQAAKAATQPSASAGGGQSGLDYDEDPLGYGDEEDYEYSDAEHFDDHYLPPPGAPNGYEMQPPAANKKKKKKSKGSSAHQDSVYNPELVGNNMPPLPHPPPPPVGILRNNNSSNPNKSSNGDIWNTSTQQERQNIKDFWLSLSEDERKSLLKIEKEAVLRKMKQQQKHSCSCTVCGRKRTAIEEELEVLYEGYYEELEQYAHHDHPPNLSGDGMIPEPLHHPRLPPPLAAPPPPNPHHKTSHLHEHLDDDEYSDEEDYSDDDDYSDDALSPSLHARSAVPDFFTFGQNLTVKGILTPWLEKLQSGLKGNADNILTVADDLLKNDGRKFIEMMEQLAERRMQRENEAEYAATNPSHPGGYPAGDPGFNHEDPLAAGDEFDDEEASYDSQEEYDDDMDDEDEMGGLTEEQRMQEGRRMFQIFAARMFEQRVLTAYKEKVAAERQQKLLEELEDETKLEAQREAKKQRDAQKKKDKKKQQQAAKAEEKARKEAEKAAEEARIREAEEAKQEEQRRKKEEQRKKREEEKRKQDEDRARKEADRLRRQQEEQQKREETERKSREQKAVEKARKEDSRKREREERETREKEARERKAREEKEKKERDAKVKAEKEAKEREKTTQQATQPPTAPLPHQISKRPSQAGMVAVPGVPRQNAPGMPSPHPSVATPAIPIPKAPTPATSRQHQPSQQGSHGSSPKQPQSQVSSVPSKSSSPNSAAATQPVHTQFTSGAPKIMQKPTNQQQASYSTHPMQMSSPIHQNPMQPPPGMPLPPQHSAVFSGMPPVGFSALPAPSASMLHGAMGPRSPMPMYPTQAPAAGIPNRFGPPGINGPPAGMMPQQARMGYPFDVSGSGSLPPGFGHSQTPNAPPPHQTSPIYQPQAAPAHADAPRAPLPSHSRQASINEKDRFESVAAQPIARPAPIQRPSSVKPQEEETGDVDDLSKHLGSSALLDDTDEPMPPSLIENRRQSNLASSTRGPASGMAPLGGFGAPGSFGASGGSWNTPNLPFGQGSGLGQPNWGSLPNQGMGGWTSNNGAFAPNPPFGSIGASQMHRPTGAGSNRPLTIRIAVCQACRQLTTAKRGDSDGYHDVNFLLRQIEANRVPLDTPPTLREIVDICETEGDPQNGGGELHVRRGLGASSASFAVMWQPLAGTPEHARGMGEIGSPLPSKSSPVGANWGAPGLGRAPGGFGNLGATIGQSAPGGGS